MGFIIYGNEDSPVVPLMLYMPAKIGYIVWMAQSSLSLDRGYRGAGVREEVATQAGILFFFFSFLASLFERKCH